MDYHINEMNDNSGDTNYFNSIKSNSNTNDNINSNDSINICNDSKQNKSTISQNNTNFLTGNENFKFNIPLSFYRLIDMRGMFSGCNSLISLPDISKWNTSNVNDMSGMFSGCYSLISLPDISKWKTNIDKDILNESFNCLNKI